MSKDWIKDNIEIGDTGIQIEYKSSVDAYTYLFMFFHDEHGLTLLNAEMDDIVMAVNHFKELFNKDVNEPKSY